MSGTLNGKNEHKKQFDLLKQQTQKWVLLTRISRFKQRHLKPTETSKKVKLWGETVSSMRVKQHKILKQTLLVNISYVVKNCVPAYN